MAGKVFISCGQNNQNEKNVANKISKWLINEGYEPYVAIQIQSTHDVNDIIKELKNSDFFLFINFKRERIIKSIKSIDSLFKPTFKGSLFTNQELSIAYSMGFEKIISVSQKNVKKEGLFRYIFSNTPEFNDYKDVLQIVKNAINTAKWHPSYSRNLIAQNLCWCCDDFIEYQDHTGVRNSKVLNIDILNRRPDIGALNTQARLKSITNNNGKSSPDKSYLKCTGTIGYSNTIWPNNHIAFDLLSIDIDNPINVYLHSSLDISPRQPIIAKTGVYKLEYEIYTKSFPVLTFKVKLDLTGDVSTTKAKLV